MLKEDVLRQVETVRGAESPVAGKPAAVTPAAREEAVPVASRRAGKPGGGPTSGAGDSGCRAGPVKRKPFR